MPWRPKDLMDTQREFVQLALQEGANRRELCRRFGIGPKAGYALLKRYADEGEGAFTERSRRPHRSPGQTPEALESQIIALRDEHPAWGPRKLARRLRDAGTAEVPAPATIAAILHRHGRVSIAASTDAQPWQRFEHAAPNALWQIDFKGFFETLAGRRHPLTVLDDHSRFNLTLTACARPDGVSVQNQLQQVFTRYGLPVRINADNGAPWGAPRAPGQTLSTLAVWLVRLGIRVSYSAPYHPQTNGKLERFHRSLKAEVLNGRSFETLSQAQAAFERWRQVYNHQRPHEALNLHVPAQRYTMSPRPFPERLAPIEYGPDDHVLTVGWAGAITFQGRTFKVSKALHRMPIALRPDPERDGCFDAYFCHHRFLRLDMKSNTASN